MGKRSAFPRKDRDLYRTPPEAVAPLLPHLAGRTRFVEPFAGDGALIDALAAGGHRCVGARDIVPLRGDIACADGLGLGVGDVPWGATIISNPPWRRDVLHAAIDRLRRIAPTWLLFDADWDHTGQAARFKPYLQRVVTVGRVKWEPGSAHTGKDNCVWRLFGDAPCRTVSFGRHEPPPPVGWYVPAAGGEAFASRARGGLGRGAAA